MTAPKRIQLRRTKGWRKPEGAIVVARPTKWGNPYRASDCPLMAQSFVEPFEMVPNSKPARCRWAVVDFTSLVCFGIGDRKAYPSDDEIRRELRGHDLACWCPLDQPCRADVLLELANAPEDGDQ